MLLLASVAGLALWRAESDRNVRRSLEQRSSIVGALNDARAEYFLGGTFMAIAVFAEDRAPFIEEYRQAKVRGDLNVDRALAELAALGDIDGMVRLNAFVKNGDELEEGVNAFIEYLLAPESAGILQMAEGYQLEQWPKADELVGELGLVAEEQQGKLAAERAAADRAADAALVWMIAFSIFAFLVAAVALVALSLSVVRPLASLQATARAITSGDLGATAEVSGPEEVASLARDFNEMVGARRRAERALRKARDELEMRVEERTAALAAANEELDRLAKTDALTGLPNHRSLLERLSGELAASAEAGRPLSVVMMDIDGFKQFNDTYGHPLGDEVLKLVAGVLRQMSDGSRIPGRCGGDEFLAILPGADKEAAVAFAEGLAATVGEVEFEAGAGNLVPICLSLGVASYPEDSESKDRLLALADAAMYESRRLGGAERKGPPRTLAVGGGGFGSAFGALDSLVQAIQYRDRYTQTHSDLVAEYAAKLSLAVGLSEEATRALRIAGALHDVGKLIVPDDILKKPGRLTTEEYDLMKRHTLVGEMLIRETPFLEDVIQAVGCHHESYDGSGYPRGLRGDEIPLLGRIMAVADAYSAMCLDRPYRKALSQDEIIAELRAGAGARFDARLVDVFIDMLKAERQLRAA